MSPKGSHALDGLRRAGLLNEIAPDLSELMEDHTPKYMAFCTSDDCCKRKYKPRSAKTKKEVDQGTFWCPDCGDALLWKKQRNRKHD